MHFFLSFVKPSLNSVWSVVYETIINLLLHFLVEIKSNMGLYKVGLWVCFHKFLQPPAIPGFLPGSRLNETNREVRCAVDLYLVVD